MSNSQRRIWPISLHQIEATVSAHLGPGRVQGNHQESAFSRQVSMYLAKRVGLWCSKKIGKFYNGRHHSTVLYSIEKIEGLRERDARLDALLELLCAELSAWSAHARLLSPYQWDASVDRVNFPLPSSSLAEDLLLQSRREKRVRVGDGHASQSEAHSD